MKSNFDELFPLNEGSTKLDFGDIDPIGRALQEVGVSENKEVILDKDVPTLVKDSYVDIKEDLKMTYYAPNGERRVKIDEYEGLSFKKKKSSKKRIALLLLKYGFLLAVFVGIIVVCILHLTGVIDLGSIKLPFLN